MLDTLKKDFESKKTVDPRTLEEVLGNDSTLELNDILKKKKQYNLNQWNRFRIKLNIIMRRN